MTNHEPRLPLPETLGGPMRPFAEAVDAYVEYHSVSHDETYRRIAEITGNRTSTLHLRYRNRGDEVWWFSDPLG